MLAVDRGNYVGHKAYQVASQRIGYNITISAPHMHAHALELLKDHLKPGCRALDVGSGSGYLTACMAHMVGEQGLVVGIDHIAQLVDASLPWWWVTVDWAGLPVDPTTVSMLEPQPPPFL